MEHLVLRKDRVEKALQKHVDGVNIIVVKETAIKPTKVLGLVQLITVQISLME